MSSSAALQGYKLQVERITRIANSLNHFTNLVKVDHDNSKVSLLLKADPMLKVLQKRQNEGEKGLDATWHPEFAAYMIEGTPG